MKVVMLYWILQKQQCVCLNPSPVKCKKGFTCFNPSNADVKVQLCVCVSVTVSSAAPEDQQTSVLLSEGSFSWLGSGGSDPPGSERDEGSGAGSGSLILHAIDLSIPKVHACTHTRTDRHRLAHASMYTHTHTHTQTVSDSL